jgi:hypothetical protein
VVRRSEGKELDRGSEGARARLNHQATKRNHAPRANWRTRWGDRAGRPTTDKCGTDGEEIAGAEKGPFQDGVRERTHLLRQIEIGTGMTAAATDRQVLAPDGDESAILGSRSRLRTRRLRKAHGARGVRLTAARGRRARDSVCDAACGAAAAGARWNSAPEKDWKQQARERSSRPQAADLVNEPAHFERPRGFFSLPLPIYSICVCCRGQSPVRLQFSWIRLFLPPFCAPKKPNNCPNFGHFGAILDTLRGGPSTVGRRTVGEIDEESCCSDGSGPACDSGRRIADADPGSLPAERRMGTRATLWLFGFGAACWFWPRWRADAKRSRLSPIS